MKNAKVNLTEANKTKEKTKMEKTVVANRNGVGEVRSNWYFTDFDSEEKATIHYNERLGNKIEDGWDRELLLLTRKEAVELDKEND